MIICDTHALIFAALDSRRLSAKARQVIESAQASGTLACADISLWEIGMLIEKGRIKVNLEPVRFLDRIVTAFSLQILPITAEIAALANSEAIPRGDPADRLIAATALTHGASLVTKDTLLSGIAELKTVW